MPKWIHDRAQKILESTKEQYGKDKGKQVAFALATQQAHATGKAPKKWHGKPFGTSEGKREAKEKYDQPSKMQKSAIDASRYLRPTELIKKWLRQEKEASPIGKDTPPRVIAQDRKANAQQGLAGSSSGMSITAGKKEKDKPKRKKPSAARGFLQGLGELGNAGLMGGDIALQTLALGHEGLTALGQEGAEKEGSRGMDITAAKKTKPKGKSKKPSAARELLGMMGGNLALEGLGALGHAGLTALGQEGEEKKDSGPTEEQVAEFFSKNPNPEDEEFHAWAESHGWEPDDAEAVAYRLATRHAEFMFGGKSGKEGKTVEDFDADQVSKGVKVEKEHTDNMADREKITADHLVEDKKYYNDPLFASDLGKAGALLPVIPHFLACLNRLEKTAAAAGSTIWPFKLASVVTERADVPGSDRILRTLVYPGGGPTGPSEGEQFREERSTPDLRGPTRRKEAQASILELIRKTVQERARNVGSGGTESTPPPEGETPTPGPTPSQALDYVIQTGQSPRMQQLQGLR